MYASFNSLYFHQKRNTKRLNHPSSSKHRSRQCNQLLPWCRRKRFPSAGAYWVSRQTPAITRFIAHSESLETPFTFCTIAPCTTIVQTHFFLINSHSQPLNDDTWNWNITWKCSDQVASSGTSHCGKAKNCTPSSVKKQKIMFTAWFKKYSFHGNCKGWIFF